jgi:hypothetical protein
MVNAILLVYYEKYFETSLHEFVKILDNLELDYNLLIISNNDALNYKNHIIHKGNNSHWEFSGWDRGIKLINSYSKNDFFIFCNDTFCHHRRWGFIQRDSFTYAFKNAITENFKGIVGEVDTFKEIFSINNYEASSWVSTYLFGMSGELLDKFNGCISLSDKSLKQLIVNVDGGKIFWADGSSVSYSLKKRIENWLNEKNIHGWYNRNCSDGIKLKKIRSILNEIYISTYAQILKYKLWDVYSNISLYKKIYISYLRCATILKNFSHLFK